MRYRVMVQYRSAWGALSRGDEVDLDETTAAWLLRDSPGCIEPVKPPKPPEAAVRAVEAPEAHRMVQAAPIKRGPGRPPKVAHGDD